MSALQLARHEPGAARLQPQPAALPAAARPAAADALVRVHGVHKAYRMGQVMVKALNGVDLSIGTQGFTVLSGPSGSGKTTLLNLIGGLDRPDAGRIEIAGQATDVLDENALAALRSACIGFVFQHFNLLPVLTALENVEYPLVLQRVAPAERRERALQMLDAVGVGKLAQQRPAQMSGGQQQRVAIARALVKRPPVLLADEPTANLDSANASAVLALLAQMQREMHMAVVISSHDALVVQHADQVVRLQDGCVLNRER